MAPDWLIQVAWFVAGVFGTGALWYFLSRNERVAALWTVFAMIVCVEFALALQIQNDLLRSQARDHEAVENEERLESEAHHEASANAGRPNGGAHHASREEAGPWPPVGVTLTDGTVVDVEMSLQFQVKPEDVPKAFVQLGPSENVAPYLRPLVEAATVARLSPLTYGQVVGSLTSLSAEITRAVANRARPAGITVHGVFIARLTPHPSAHTSRTQSP